MQVSEKHGLMLKNKFVKSVILRSGSDEESFERFLTSFGMTKT